MKIVSFFFLIFSFSVNAQNSNQMRSDKEKMMEEFMKSRKQMMDTMLDAFGKDDFFEDDMDDDFFKSILGDRFKTLRTGFGGNLVTVNQVRNSDGTIDVFIKPKDKSVQVDIETKGQMIIVKGKQSEKIENTNKSGTSSSMNQSSFSNSISIPFGYVAGSPVAVEDQIKITLTRKKLSPNGKIPIGKKSGESTL
jgi:hypothetical protein